MGMGKAERRKHDKRKILKYALVLFLIIFLVSAALLLLEIWDRRQGKFPAAETDDPTIEYNGTTYVPKDALETFLIIGLDTFEDEVKGEESYNNSLQADFLVLLVFDNESGRCTALQINRDTMASVNILGVAGNKVNTAQMQIALAHTYGNGREVSCRNTADAVSALLLNTRIDHYISVTMDAVPVLNDLAGGVEVTVLDDFSGVDDTLIEGEEVTLRGEQALTYVRARYGVGDSTNVTRMKRQQQYMNALYQKIQSCTAEDGDFLVRATLDVAEYMISDRSVTQLQELARKFTEYEFQGIRTIEGESRVGEKYMEFYPDGNALKELAIELFYEPKA